MIHNDILKRVRFALRLNDGATLDVFELADYKIDIDYLKAMMKKEDETGFVHCRDKVLSLFLDGLIVKTRGKSDKQPIIHLKAGEKLSNNTILRKLKIALQMKDTDIIDVLRYANFKVSKSELSALFRKPDHRSFRPCGDQLLRNFLTGLVRKKRPETHQ